MVKEFMECRDRYNKPKIEKGADAILEQFKSLLHIAKGSIPENPNIGFHHDALKFRNINQVELENLSTTLKEQLGDLFPESDIDTKFGIDTLKSGEEFIYCIMIINDESYKIDMKYDSTAGYWISNKDFKL